MCGIVGLYAKSSKVADELGVHLSAMLGQMNDRGPDSAGVAIYRDPVPAGTTKLVLHSADAAVDWSEIAREAGHELGGSHDVSVRASHAVVVVDAEADAATDWVRAHHPELRIMSAGRVIEIYKEVGLPTDFIETFDLTDVSGTHALGHTRMATESAVTTLGSHPFSTGLDLCLVHNGSLSNHNRLRAKLRRAGIEFQTENDTEVAAGYMTWRLREGASLTEALERAMVDLDGFFTFAIGTADGFAVLRDPIGCKPAVLAETDDWVAMASEFRAIAMLPGADDARIWEPVPGRIYTWEGAAVA